MQKMIFVLGFISVICSCQDNEVSDSSDSMTVVAEAEKPTEFHRDSLCYALILEGELKAVLETIGSLDPIEDAALVSKKVLIKDSIYSLLRGLDLNRGGVGYYNDAYREECLLCWADQIGADLDEMAIAANKANLISPYSASYLPVTLSQAQSFYYEYDNQSRPYYMKMGKRIIVTDTVQNKLEICQDIEQQIHTADSLISPVFGKGLLEFSPEELVFYRALRHYDVRSNSDSLEIKAE